MPSINSQRIAKNMMMLYFRMFFQMAVYFYTSRKLFATIGDTDYGIYDVVAGFVIGLTFLNNAMSTCTLRFITYAIGNDNVAYIRKVFATSLNIHIVLAILIVLIGEPIGMWYIEHKMQLPPERYEAALWVFHASMFSAFMMILSVPYNTLIIAYERMSAFAYLTILDVLLKLGVVLSLQFVTIDKLSLYAILLAGEALIIRLIYAIYCNVSFPTARYTYSKDKKLYIQMFSFAGWSMFGNFSNVLNVQGLNLLLNYLGGPIIGPLYNAARAIAIQVQLGVNSFISSFQTSINPQITKSYAANELEVTNKLVLISARISFLLALMLIFPIFVECRYFLELWMNKIPEYTVFFTRALLVVSLLEALSNPLMIAAEATGRIKRFHVLISIPLYLTLPLAYLAFSVTKHIGFVFVTLIITNILAQIVKMYLSRELFNFSVKNYLSQVLLRITLVILLTIIAFVLLHYIFGEYHSLWNALIVFLCSLLTIYGVGLRPIERKFILQKFYTLLNRIR